VFQKNFGEQIGKIDDKIKELNDELKELKQHLKDVKEGNVSKKRKREESSSDEGEGEEGKKKKKKLPDDPDKILKSISKLKDRIRIWENKKNRKR